MRILLFAIILVSGCDVIEKKTPGPWFVSLGAGYAMCDHLGSTWNCGITLTECKVYASTGQQVFEETTEIYCATTVAKSPKR